MNHIYSFEKMLAWQLARELTKEVYVLTKAFPKEETFGMTSQLRRAAVSICCNLAEGSARLGGKAQGYFYQIAYGSAVELLNLLIICNDLEYSLPESVDLLRLKIEKLTFQINKLVPRDPGTLSEPDAPYESPI